VQVDGAEPSGLGLKEQGQPVAFVHAAEGSPLIRRRAAFFSARRIP